MMATFVHDGRGIDYTPAADVASGEVVVMGDLVGVAPRSIPAGGLGTIAVEGVFDFAKATGASTAIDAGAVVYWDAANEVATETEVGNTRLGKCVQDAEDDDTTVRVKLIP